MGKQNIQANDVNCTDHDVSITMLLVLEIDRIRKRQY